MASPSSHGPATRRPVVHGGRRIPSLWERSLKDGGTVYEAKLRIGGKSKRVVLEARSATEAIRELEALRVDRDRGVEQRNPLINPTVEEVTEERLAEMEARVGIADERRRFSENTVNGYRYQLERWILPRIGAVPVGDLTTVRLRRLIDELAVEKTSKGLPLAPSSQHASMGALSAVLSYAVRRGYLERNPCLDLTRGERPSRRRRTEPRYLSPAELERLFAATTDARYRTMFETMAFAALRASEVFGLRWGDLDLKGGRLEISGQLSRDGKRRIPVKTAASATAVEMAPALRRALVEHRSRMAERDLRFVRPDAYVFISKLGRTFDNRNVYEALRRAADAAGLNGEGREPVGLHDLRHSAIAIAIRSGAPITEVAEFARHSSPATTLSTYAGLAQEDRGGALRRMLDAGYGA